MSLLQIQNDFGKSRQKEGFGLDHLFICHKMVSFSMRKSTSQKTLQTIQNSLADQMWPAGRGLGSPDLIAWLSLERLQKLALISFILFGN